MNDLAGLTKPLEGWIRRYDVESAYATSDAAVRALTSIGIATAARLSRSHDAHEKRHLVLIDAHAGVGEDAVAMGALATKIVVVVAQNGRRLFGSSRQGAVIPVLWSIGRVRERQALREEGFVDAWVPPNLVPRVARWEAFLVDVTPRTPQARRKLLRTVP